MSFNYYFLVIFIGFRFNLHPKFRTINSIVSLLTCDIYLAMSQHPNKAC